MRLILLSWIPNYISDRSVEYRERRFLITDVVRKQNKN